GGGAEARGPGGGASADVPDSHVARGGEAPRSRTPVASGSATIKPMVAMASAYRVRAARVGTITKSEASPTAASASCHSECSSAQPTAWVTDISFLSFLFV